MKPLTRKQREAIQKLWNRRNHETLDDSNSGSYLTFRRRFYQTHMNCVCGFVGSLMYGIEPDGYTHT